MNSPGSSKGRYDDGASGSDDQPVKKKAEFPPLPRYSLTQILNRPAADWLCTCLSADSGQHTPDCNGPWSKVAPFELSNTVSVTTVFNHTCAKFAIQHEQNMRPEKANPDVSLGQTTKAERDAVTQLLLLYQRGSYSVFFSSWQEAAKAAQEATEPSAQARLWKMLRHMKKERDQIGQEAYDRLVRQFAWSSLLTRFPVRGNHCAPWSTVTLVTDNTGKQSLFLLFDTRGRGKSRFVLFIFTLNATPCTEGYYASHSLDKDVKLPTPTPPHQELGVSVSREATHLREAWEALLPFILPMLDVLPAECKQLHVHLYRLPHYPKQLAKLPTHYPLLNILTSLISGNLTLASLVSQGNHKLAGNELKSRLTEQCYIQWFYPGEPPLEYSPAWFSNIFVAEQLPSEPPAPTSYYGIDDKHPSLGILYPQVRSDDPAVEALGFIQDIAADYPELTLLITEHYSKIERELTEKRDLAAVLAVLWRQQHSDISTEKGRIEGRLFPREKYPHGPPTDTVKTTPTKMERGASEKIPVGEPSAEESLKALVWRDISILLDGIAKRQEEAISRNNKSKFFRDLTSEEMRKAESTAQTFSFLRARLALLTMSLEEKILLLLCTTLNKGNIHQRRIFLITGEDVSKHLVAQAKASEPLRAFNEAELKKVIADRTRLEQECDRLKAKCSNKVVRVIAGALFKVHREASAPGASLQIGFDLIKLTRAALKDMPREYQTELLTKVFYHFLDMFPKIVHSGGVVHSEPAERSKTPQSGGLTASQFSLPALPGADTLEDAIESAIQEEDRGHGVPTCPRPLSIPDLILKIGAEAKGDNSIMSTLKEGELDRIRGELEELATLFTTMEAFSQIQQTFQERRPSYNAALDPSIANKWRQWQRLFHSALSVTLLPKPEEPPFLERMFGSPPRKPSKEEINQARSQENAASPGAQRVLEERRASTLGVRGCAAIDDPVKFLAGHTISTALGGKQQYVNLLAFIKDLESPLSQQWLAEQKKILEERLASSPMPTKAGHVYYAPTLFSNNLSKRRVYIKMWLEDETEFNVDREEDVVVTRGAITSLAHRVETFYGTKARTMLVCILPSDQPKAPEFSVTLPRCWAWLVVIKRGDAVACALFICGNESKFNTAPHYVITPNTALREDGIGYALDKINRSDTLTDRADFPIFNMLCQQYGTFVHALGWALFKQQKLPTLQAMRRYQSAAQETSLSSGEALSQLPPQIEESAFHVFTHFIMAPDPLLFRTLLESKLRDRLTDTSELKQDFWVGLCDAVRGV